MITGTASDAASVPLSAVLEQAGAVLSNRGGHPVVVHYGSPAGELAVCVRGVGVVDRSHLDKLFVDAPPEALEWLMDRVLGDRVAVGGALRFADAWWCREALTRLVVLCDARVGDRVRARLHDAARRQASLAWREASGALAAIGLLGRRTSDLLRALGVYGPHGDPRRTPPFAAAEPAGIESWWLLESDHRALALVGEDRAGDLWRLIEHAGLPFGVSCVGAEAAARYALLERSRVGSDEYGRTGQGPR
jgi:glycine cleavage system aminomethyltransferase T